MNKPKSNFITKTAVKAQLNSPLVMRKNNAVLFSEKLEEVDQATALINGKTTELKGIFPNLFSAASYLFENMPEKIIKGEKGSLYYQLGTKDDPIPADVFLKLGIGNFKDQKNFFMKELYKLWEERRYYWLPTGNDGDMIFMPPIQVFPVTTSVITDPAELKRLSQIGADRIIKGFVMECYKPLFDGHLNGYKDGFIKQPKTWPAKIKNGVKNLVESKAKFFDIEKATDEEKETQRDMTTMNILKIWEFLALHDNGKGEIKDVDVIDLLSHVTPSFLKNGKYIRRECVISLLNALITLTKLTYEHRDELDFRILSLELDQYDHEYAARHRNKRDENLFGAEALIHHLKANNNHLTLKIERRGHGKK